MNSSLNLLRMRGEASGTGRGSFQLLVHIEEEPTELKTDDLRPKELDTTERKTGPRL
jgi:hypothetical protein